MLFATGGEGLVSLFFPLTGSGGGLGCLVLDETLLVRSGAGSTVSVSTGLDLGGGGLALTLAGLVRGGLKLGGGTLLSGCWGLPLAGFFLGGGARGAGFLGLFRFSVSFFCSGSFDCGGSEDGPFLGGGALG